MATPLLISTDHEGCWLDGAAGWRNTGRVIGLAIEYGFRPPDGIGPTQHMVGQYLGSRSIPDGINAWLTEAVEELAQASTEYLTSISPDGYFFEWEAGELTLRKDETE